MVLSAYSTSFLLDLKKDKAFRYDFNFNVNHDFNSDKKVEILNEDLVFSAVNDFYNVKSNIERTLTYNKGLLSMEDSMILSLPDSTYEQVESLITNISIEEYWFDNSVPSKISHFQNFLVPWGITEKAFEVSHNFPLSINDIEFNISIFEDLSSNIEYDLYPAVPMDYFTDIEFETTTLGTYLDIEWGKGFERKYSCAVEGRIDDVVFSFPLEFSRIYYDYLETPIEYRKVFNFDEPINKEFNVYEVHRDIIQNLEFSAGWEQIEHISLESNVFNIEDLNLEFLSSAPYYNNINLEYLLCDFAYKDISFEADLYPAVSSNYVMPIEFIKVYLTEYNTNIEMNQSINMDNKLDLETNISPITRSLHTNLEFKKIIIEDIETPLETNISPITKYIYIPLETNISINMDKHVNLEYWRVYLIDPAVNVEFGVSYINKDYKTNLEVSTATPFDTHINLEFLKTKESVMKFQNFVIPFGYKETYFSLLVKAQSFEELPLEFDTRVYYSPKLNLETYVSINLENISNLEYNIKDIFKNEINNLEYNIKDIFKDEVLGIEYKKIIIEDLVNNLEADIVINLDNVLNFEYDIKNIFKDEVTNIEFLMAMEEFYVNNLEYKTEINQDLILELEYIITELFKDYNFNIEFDTKINKDFLQNLEFALTEVNQSLNFEFDILDLVYYIIKNGRNIIPWLYASGEGVYDSSLEKKWDKEDTSDTVISNAFIEQLQYKGLNIPDIIQFSDNKLENFGTILTDAPGLSKDITLANTFLYFDCIDPITNEYLVLGKSKKDVIIDELKAGENLIIWDGKEGNYNELLKPQLIANNPDNIDYVMFYDQRDGKWITKYDDHELYFKYNIEGTEQLIPYIILIKIKENINIHKE